MKDNPNIDELLNGFIDGELSARQVTEVQRLLSHDMEVIERLRELQKCKMLVSSLPSVEAPSGLLDQVRISLERRTLLGHEQEYFESQQGAKHLLFRRVVSAAAMIALVAVLGIVIYSILAPEPFTEKPIAVEDSSQPAVVEVQQQTPAPAIITAGLNGRLELKTTDPVAVDAFINRVIRDNGLSGRIAVINHAEKGSYDLRCSRQDISSLLADLKSVWPKIESATLFIETEQPDTLVVVNRVDTEQIAQIFGQDSLEKSIEVAKDFAVLNNMTDFVPGKEVYAAIDGNKTDLITIPKPVLTSGEKETKKPSAPDEEKASLTIVIVDSE